MSPVIAIGKTARGDMVSKVKSSSWLGVGAVVVSAVIVVIAVLVNRQVVLSEAARKLPEISPATTVRVAKVERRAVVRQTDFHGFLIPFEELSVSADVEGEIVEQHVEVSSEVTEGQLLYKIDDAVRNIKHEEALAGLDRAISEHSLAEAQWSRIRGLEGGQTTSIEHKQAESQFLSTAAVQRQAETEVRFAALMLKRTAIQSPITGVVSNIFHRRGEYARPGLPLARIIDVERLRLVVEIEDRNVVWLKIGQPVTLETDALPGKTFEGTVYRIHPKASQDGHKFKVEILLTNADHRLKPGFFMHGAVVEPANIDSGGVTSDVLLIPREAVIEQFGMSFCCVVTKPAPSGGDNAPDMIATRTRVRVLPYFFSPRFFRVVDGLVEGDLVVTKGLQFLSDRTRVIITTD